MKGILFGLCIFLSTTSHAKEFTDEVEKDYTLRSIGRLNVTNPKGDISVQGWALDKIRLKIKKSVLADTPEQATKILSGIEYRYHISDGNIEISTQYGQALSILERLQEKEHPKVRTDMVIFAPSNLKLRIWSIDGKVTLKTWSSQAEIRSNGGNIRVEGLKGSNLTTHCSTCTAFLKNIRASVRHTGDSGAVELSNVTGKTIYVGTGTGAIKLFHLQGEQLYTSKKGAIDGQFLTGKVEFHTQQAPVEFRELSGFLSGTVENGNIKAHITDWEFLDKAIIEAPQGNIHLTLPRHFSSDVDIWSVHGKTALEFNLERSQDPINFGPEPTNHLLGRIGEGGELLKLYSDTGDISVIKGKL